MNATSTDPTHVNLEKLSLKKKRIVIAQDALAQLKQGRFAARHGFWAVVSGIYGSFFDKEALNETSLKCEVCALGAAMISSIRIFNETSISRVTNSAETMTQLSKFFTAKQMILIEIAFEKGDGYYDECDLADYSKYKKAISFSKKYRGTRQRAIAIFENIIKNNGIFKP